MVAPPFGAWVYDLPADYEIIRYGEERYYRAGGAVYHRGWRDGRGVYIRVELNF